MRSNNPIHPVDNKISDVHTSFTYTRKIFSA